MTSFVPLPASPDSTLLLTFTDIVTALSRFFRENFRDDQPYGHYITSAIDKRKGCSFDRAKYASSGAELYIYIDDTIFKLPLLRVFNNIIENRYEDALDTLRLYLTIDENGRIKPSSERLKLAYCLFMVLMNIAKSIPDFSVGIQMADIVVNRRPSVDMVLTDIFADFLIRKYRILTDMRNDILYVNTNNGKWIWGNYAEAFLKKEMNEIASEVYHKLLLSYCDSHGSKRSSEGHDCVVTLSVNEIKARITDNFVNKVISKIRIRTYADPVELDNIIEEGKRYIHFKGGILDLDKWFNKGVLSRTGSMDSIVIHTLPQEDFSLPPGEYEDLYDIERIAEQFTPTLLDAMRQWVPDPDQRLNLWMAMGYSVYPAMPYKKFFVIVGPPNSGKSTFLEFMKKALGRENTSSVTLWQLLGPRSEYYAMELYHKLANLADEGITSSVMRKSDKSFELLKALVGGASITARAPYGKPFSFQNYAKLFFVTNDESVVDVLSEDLAVANRVVVIRFKGRFKEDHGFKDRLLKEATRALPVFLVALRVLKKSAFVQLNTTDLVKLIELCKRECIKRKDDYFLPASIIRRELNIATTKLVRVLNNQGIDARYAIWKGKRGIVLPVDYKEKLTI